MGARSTRVGGVLRRPAPQRDSSRGRHELGRALLEAQGDDAARGTPPRMWFTLRPLEADYPRRAPFSIVMERELAVSADRAFAILADPAEWPRWFPDMRGMRWISPEGERAGVGAVRRADTASGDVIEHFVAWDPGRRLAFYAEKMTTPLVSEFFEDYVIEGISETRSRLRWTVGYLPRLPLRLIHGLIRPRFESMFQGAADALVRHVGPPAT